MNNSRTGMPVSSSFKVRRSDWREGAGSRPLFKPGPSRRKSGRRRRERPAAGADRSGFANRPKVLRLPDAYFEVIGEQPERPQAGG